jgi:hypothetical protein
MEMKALVIPAKAGIQVTAALWQVWMPACAGMTWQFPKPLNLSERIHLGASA